MTNKEFNSKILENEYIKWVKSNTSFSDLEDGIVKIDVPFLDAFSDEIIMYAVLQKDGSILLTDDGWTIDNLESYGVSITRSKKRREIFENEIRTFGVSEIDESLCIKTSIENLPESKHRLLQSIIFVNDMFMLAPRTTQSLFIEDMENFLDKNDIRFSKDMSIVGKSGLTHKFDFVISGSKTIPEKLIKTMAAPNNSMFAKSIVTDKEDTQRDSEFYVFLQDFNQENNKKIKINKDIINLFKINNIIPVTFSERDKIAEKLAE